MCLSRMISLKHGLSLSLRWHRHAHDMHLQRTHTRANAQASHLRCEAPRLQDALKSEAVGTSRFLHFTQCEEGEVLTDKQTSSEDMDPPSSRVLQ